MYQTIGNVRGFSGLRSQETQFPKSIVIHRQGDGFWAVTVFLLEMSEFDVNIDFAADRELEDHIRPAFCLGVADWGVCAQGIQVLENSLHSYLQLPSVASWIWVVFIGICEELNEKVNFSSRPFLFVDDLPQPGACPAVLSLFDHVTYFLIQSLLYHFFSFDFAAFD